MPAPLALLIAGPNGAGKSTAAPGLLRGALRVDEFVNADAIASGLQGSGSEEVGLAAGRVMLLRLRELAAARRSFAFETTLASRSFAAWLTRLARVGYSTRLVYLSLPTPELAVERVAGRTRMGGHSVPEAVVRRRFRAGIRNLIGLYVAVVEAWQVFDHSQRGPPIPLAEGGRGRETVIHDPDRWDSMLAWAR